MLKVRELYIKYSKQKKNQINVALATIYYLCTLYIKMHVSLLKKVSDYEMNHFLNSSGGLAGYKSI